MTQATATTALKAGRQHGGGLVHANQPRATLRSRHQLPSGGAIKSLCCTAAGILPPLLRATTGRVYPTTCVRRAPDQSEPLRSPIRPLAQPVVGYAHYLNIKGMAIGKRHNRFRHTTPLFIHVGGPLANSETFKAHTTLQSLTERTNGHRKAALNSQPESGHLLILNLGESNQCHVIGRLLKQPYKVPHPHTVNTLHIHQLTMQMFNARNSVTSTMESLLHVTPRLSQSITIPRTVLISNNSETSTYRQDRANCLNPAGSHPTSVNCQHQDVRQRENDNSPRNSRVPLNEDPNSFTPHTANSLASKDTSVPLFSIQVHGSAA